MNSRIDVLKDHYDREKYPQQALEIQSEIIRFAKEYNDFYNKLGFNLTIPSFASFALFCAGGAWMWLGIPLLTGGVFFSNDKLLYSSSAQWKTFTESHARLFALYDWCCKTGKNVTQDSVFLELLEAVAPFTQDTERLKPACLYKQGISIRFQKILGSTPHNIVFDQSSTNIEKSDKSAELATPVAQKALGYMKFLMFNCDKKKVSDEKVTAAVEAKPWTTQIYENGMDLKRRIFG